MTFSYLLLASRDITVLMIPYLKNRPVADWAKSSGVKQFLFISSAGIYKPTDEPPHVEGVCIINSAYLTYSCCTSNVILLSK